MGLHLPLPLPEWHWPPRNVDHSIVYAQAGTTTCNRARVVLGGGRQQTTYKWHLLFLHPIPSPSSLPSIHPLTRPHLYHHPPTPPTTMASVSLSPATAHLDIDELEEQLDDDDHLASSSSSYINYQTPAGDIKRRRRTTKHEQAILEALFAQVSGPSPLLVVTLIHNNN